MKPRRVSASNVVFRLTGGNEDNDLWVERTFHAEDGAPLLISTWELSDDDRAAIAAGGTVELIVWGEGHPPVAMQVVPPTTGDDDAGRL